MDWLTFFFSVSHSNTWKELHGAHKPQSDHICYTVWVVKWLLYWNRSGRKRLWPNWGTILAFNWTDRGKPWKNLSQDSQVLAKIQNEHFPNTNPEDNHSMQHCHWNLFRFLSLFRSSYIVHWGQQHHSCQQDTCISVIHIHKALEIQKWLHNDYVWLSYFRSMFHLCTVLTPLLCYSLPEGTSPLQ
jgi:hypothetical protein